ncbi:MAG: cytochrome P450 [Thermosynechococcaceae cyanobacterium]
MTTTLHRNTQGPNQAPLTFADIPSLNAPKLVQLLQGVFNPMPTLERSRQRYGDIIRSESVGFPPMVAIGCPEGVEAVLTADPTQFEVGSGNRSLRPLLGEHSLIQLDGSQHQRQRKLMMPSFHGASVQRYGEVMTEVTESVMAQWRPGQAFPIHSSMQEITLRVILKAVFGLAEGERFDQLQRLLCEFTDGFNSPWQSLVLFLEPLQQDLGAWSPWGKFLRCRQKIDQLLLEEICDRRQQPPQDDVLSLLLAARDEDDGSALSDLELRDELMTLLFAGHETTASVLAWAIYWIHSQPEVKQKVMAELSALGPDPDPMEIAKLPYLTAVCNETLRIYPVVLFTFGRILKQPFDLMGYRLEPGIMLAPCIYLLHHNPELYPDSKTFRPERFLERQFSPYEFIPFGGSNRRCLGYTFALFEIKVVLATMLRSAQLELVSDRPAVPVRRGGTFMPSEGVQVQLVQ